MHKNDGGMSFKNLPTFNLAMLGKQGWRLMKNSNLLVARLYKANDITLIPQIDGDFPLVDLRVSGCMLHDRKEWNLPFLQSIFDHQVVEHIMNSPLYPSVTEDRLIWKKRKSW